jgi:polar amino acid transport system permease protein
VSGSARPPSGPSPRSSGPSPQSGRRSSLRPNLIAALSTVVVFGGLGFVIVNAPGWPRVQASFFDADVFWASLPGLIAAFWINVRLFLIAEVLILVVGLAVAVLRSLPGPLFFPVRVLAIAYADLFRAVPGLLVIFFLGFGIPTLRLPGVPRDPFFWAAVALTLVYSAYVSEVYRAGIESIHPSQEAAARSLGLSRFQSLRFVIVPQAVRRVIPPLLNDFIGLQKDTVFVSFVGVVEVFRESQIKQSTLFNFTPYLATALIFVILTIPLARLTDWLVARDRHRGERRA